MKDEKRVGSVIYNLGVVNGILNVEAVRIAQEKFGHRALTGEEVSWGFDHLDLDDAAIAKLGATGLVEPIHVTCADHEGGGSIKIQQWDGTKWNVLTDWIPADRALLRPLIEESAAKYAAEKNITPRVCS
jgi:branched-chain amino acid transport system substrate-binding protein